MTLVSHELVHLILSLVVTGGLAGIFRQKLSWKKSWLFVVGGFIGGIVLDIDHLIDYFLAYGWQIKLNDFLAGNQFRESQKVYVVLHSWEVAVMLAVVAWVSKNKQAKYFLSALALGIVSHLGYDIVYYQFDPLAYFLIYRLAHNFYAGIF